MRIAVLDKEQLPTDSPARYISKTRAMRFLHRRIAKWLIVGEVLQMLKEGEVIRTDQEFLRARLEVIPAKRTRWNRNLLLHYPHRSQESKGMR